MRKIFRVPLPAVFTDIIVRVFCWKQHVSFQRHETEHFLPNQILFGIALTGMFLYIVAFTAEKCSMLFGARAF